MSLALLDSTTQPLTARERPFSTQPGESVPSQAVDDALEGGPLTLRWVSQANGKEPALRSRPVAPSPTRTEPLVLEQPTATGESAAAVLLEVVAEKTGYPADVLELDMQLDADLGIDSIKRVEILSALQDRLAGLPSIEPERLGSFRSLRAIVEFLGQAPHDHEQPVAMSKSSAPGPEGDPSGAIARLLVDIVAEKTGYPSDMLELDMRLDTDLGIDSIKRVEIFAALQDRLPGCRSAGAEEIGGMGTLREIVAFLAEPSHETVAKDVESTGARASDAPASARSANLRLLHPTVRALEARQDRQRLRLDSGGAVWITEDGSELTEAVGAALTSQGMRVRVIELDDRPTPVAPDRLSGLIILAPREPGETFVKDAFRILQAVGPALRQSAARADAAFATVSRLDGAFGLRGLDPTIGSAVGALAGMAKTAGREWPEVHCKALDLDFAFDSPAAAAELIVDELLERGPAEVGLSRRGRLAVELEPAVKPTEASRQPLKLERGDLVVISGGARGITAEVAVALASSYGPRLLLLGRTPVPGTRPDWMNQIHDEVELKRALLERANGQSSPRAIGEQARRLMREREISQNLARIASAGSPAIYRSVDVRDGQAVSAVIAEIQGQYGAIRGLIHGAGVLADRRIADQTEAEFDSIYDTKVAGLRHLLRAIDPELLSFLFLFSSSTARFGRSGQVAYAAANEALNKFAQQQARLLPYCHVVAYNWGPWAGGMVQDSLMPVFEKEGISLIPLDVGAHLVIDEIRSGASGSVEIVVLAEPQTASRDNVSSRQHEANSPVVDQKMKAAFRRTVDLESQPVLAAHVIDGHAVLPFALVMEWLAQGAVQRNPGLVVCGIDNMRLHRGVILGADRQAEVEVRVAKALRKGDHFLVAVELSGTLASGREVARPSRSCPGQPIRYACARTGRWSAFPLRAVA